MLAHNVLRKELAVDGENAAPNLMAPKTLMYISIRTAEDEQRQTHKAINM